MYYYRRSNKNDYEDDIRNLNNKIDIIYSLLENITKDRNDLLILFNSRINDNVPNENIFHNDIYFYDSCRTSKPRRPQLYRLPKIHKPGNPIRPIVSFYNTPLSSLHKQLSNIIKPLTL